MSLLDDVDNNINSPYLVYHIHCVVYWTLSNSLELDKNIKYVHTFVCTYAWAHTIYLYEYTYMNSQIHWMKRENTKHKASLQLLQYKMCLYIERHKLVRTETSYSIGPCLFPTNTINTRLNPVKGVFH
uniref:Ovule protein n=1 Tax=Heterorhabditis bacteriophora TaxID=37862 RepID=A0A1I7WTW1_HETBA